MPVNGRPLRIVICEDSPTYARALGDFLARDPGLEIAGSFRSAEEMLPELAAVEPDLITLDLEMPGMGGVAATHRIMRDRPVPILVVSAHAGEGSEQAAEALAAGALEAIPKLRLRLFEPGDVWADALRSRIKRLASIQLRSRPRGGRVGLPATGAASIDRVVRVVGIGTSTGGPPALLAVLGSLPAAYPLPVLVVQHIASGFGEGLVRWLDRQVAPAVRFAEDGAEARPGIWVAPDDAHLRLMPSMHFSLDDETVRGAHRPSLDVLFESLAESAGAAAAGVVLTGMGRDGAEGVEALRAAGGLVVAQDEASSAVFGMPRAAIESGADLVLGLPAVAATLRKLPKPEVKP
jgi:two-component system chemotaxis response regulator CheB